MFATFHFNSANDLTLDIVEAIKATFQGKPIVIIVEEEVNE